jgi:membrane-associated phospholipid phosphatase
MNFRFRSLDFRFLFFIFVFNFSVFAFDVNDINSTAATGSWKRDGKRFVKIAFEDAEKTFFEKDNLFLLLMAGGGSIALADRADGKIADHFERHRSMPQDLDKFTELAGNPGTHFAATGIWYGIAANKKDDINIQRSWIMFRALAVTNVTTLGLKLIVNNHTPNNHSLAWPSGHTASSFTVAAVLDEFYGHKVGVPAYLAAGFVGYRMMDSGDHWASDVLFGGVLGYVVGHAIAGENKELRFAGFRIQPLITTLHKRPSAGVALAKEF